MRSSALLAASPTSPASPGRGASRALTAGLRLTVLTATKQTSARCAPTDSPQRAAHALAARTRTARTAPVATAPARRARRGTALVAVRASSAPWQAARRAQGAKMFATSVRRARFYLPPNWPALLCARPARTLAARSASPATRAAPRAAQRGPTSA